MQPYRLPGPLGSWHSPVLKSWPAQHQLALLSCAVWLACSLHASWLSPDAFPRAPLTMEICWAALLSSAGVLCMHLSLPACRLNTAKRHRSITRLHLPHSLALPSPPHRPLYCALPSEAGLPSPQHSPLSFLACSNPHLHPPPFLLPQSGSLHTDGTGGHC